MPAQTQARRPSTQPALALQTIVFATDFSDNAARALEWATELARTHSAQIVVVHAIDTELPALAEATEPVAKHVRRQLETIQERLKAGKLRVQTKDVVGRPWDVIAKVAKEANADLIVIGAHGKSKFSQRVLGTAADRLIRTTSTPVLVHRVTTSKAARAMPTVLAATDFSEDAALAISAAVRLLCGAKSPARLVLFHTVALPISYLDVNVPMPVPQYWDDAERTAARRLETIAASLRSDRLQVEVKTFRGYPAEAILHEAEMINADLIAIGTVGRTGLNRFFMGSVAERVLHHAECPVLTVRKPDANEPIRLSAE
jgi:nucleotide-binding universal stress UspA family protein